MPTMTIKADQLGTRFLRRTVTVTHKKNRIRGVLTGLHIDGEMDVDPAYIPSESIEAVLDRTVRIKLSHNDEITIED